MSSSRKRKQRPDFNTSRSRSNRLIYDDEEYDQDHKADASLSVQAYEADVIRGPRAAHAAASLEIFDYEAGRTVPIRKIGNALIQWGEDQHGKPPAFPGDEDEFISSSKQAVKFQNDDKNTVWVDRYDGRLLLDALPLQSRSANLTMPSVPDSPGGWSDLPSDSEDTFFLSPEETEDFHREKKRRLLNQNRDERLRARRREDGESSEPEENEEIWGGSDEEPDDSQRELMRRTAQHILSSPNPAQLEMRILTNHGGDKKFAFLKGRWSRAWMIIRGKAKREKEEHEKEKEGKKGGGLGILAGYGDSEDESEDNDAHNAGNTKYNQEREDVDKDEMNENPLDDNAAKEARRARAKAWAEKRRVS